VGKHDLVAYVCESKKCLTWFIHSNGFGFKMEIPFDTILNMEFSNAAPGSGLASFFLSQPPLFYLEGPTQSQADGTVTRQWKRCSDWTEGQQATTVLHHELIGSAVQLAHLLRNLRANNPSTDIHLHSPSYHRPMDVPIALQSRLDADQRLHRHVRRRSYSGPPVSHHSQQSVANFPSLDVNIRDALAQGPPSAVFPSHSFSQMQTQAQSSNPQFAPAMFDQFSAMQTGNQLLSQSHHFEEAGLSQYPTDALRRRASTVHLPSYTHAHTPSPPISAPVPIPHPQTLGSAAHLIPDMSVVSFKAEKRLLPHEEIIDQSETVRGDPSFDIQSQDRCMF
jgi:regulatory protein PHO2